MFDEDAMNAVESNSPGQAEAKRPVAIEVDSVEKTFRIPEHRVDTLKERILHPFSQGDFRELRALRDVSFEVRRGEFFGIVGRNGSGKSTLLKILASIYAADEGSVRIDGNLAPFIELGVGFNANLTARENVVLNGVMMGLNRREAERGLGEVLEFAELEEFVDLKLKNYSSGMLVRLAFSAMMQSEAEILLIDEVLAVGDAAFQQKCLDAFHEMRDAGRTIVLVTHDMSAVERFCHRALLLSGGKIVHLGEPDEVARRYLKINFERRPSDSDLDEPDGAATLADIRLLDAWIEIEGRRVSNVEQGAEVELHAVFEGVAPVESPSFGFMFTSTSSGKEDIDVFGFSTALESSEGQADSIGPGERVKVRGSFVNRLASGRYVVKCWVHRNHDPNHYVLHVPHVLDFVAFGAEEIAGLVSLASEAEATKVTPSEALPLKQLD
jgi:ABC-type polysaccharide/polyol phosphate transport system ATPase subunit